jgi:Ca2+-binding EF-hand superfamily protein
VRQRGHSEALEVGLSRESFGNFITDLERDFTSPTELTTEMYTIFDKNRKGFITEDDFLNV